MLRALKLQKRAARVGFDWPEIDQVLDKMKEEAEELAVELANENKDQTRIHDEVGDLLLLPLIWQERLVLIQKQLFKIAI